MSWAKRANNTKYICQYEIQSSHAKKHVSVSSRRDMIAIYFIYFGERERESEYERAQGGVEGEEEADYPKETPGAEREPNLTLNLTTLRS